MTTILTTAVSDVARALGGFATEIFEIRDAARKANHDHDHVPSVAAAEQIDGPGEEPDVLPQPNDI